MTAPTTTLVFILLLKARIGFRLALTLAPTMVVCQAVFGWFCKASFQISVPVQPGNSGGALVDERGNVVGVVSAKLSARAALASSGSLPENVNYAVKSSFLLGFLESAPEVSAKLKEPETKAQKFEDVVKSAEQSAVLVLVY